MKKDLLKEYNKKRDFKITKEPSGRSKVTKKKGKLSFVIQEHHASHLHYDFRLEWEGVLKSWAVPKGPSQEVGEKRLAMQTEDHPLAYGKFHGTIPKGEYGAGEVFIWDKGTWEPIGDAAYGLEKGHLEFRLHGGKLEGRWMLVRTNFKGTKNSWLLVKRSDEEENVIELPKKKKVAKKISSLSSKPLGKDPWPDFIAPQLPRLVTSVPAEEKWIHEMKFDGYRMQAHVKKNISNIFTRNGLNWSNSFPHTLEALNRLDVTNAIFDGEIVALDAEGRSNFQKLQNSLKSKHDNDLRYYIFDILYLNGEDLRRRPLLERKQLLQQVLKGAPKHLVYSEHFDEGEDFFKVSCEHQLEGIVSKIADSPYRSGRNDNWAKTKCSLRQEFVIGGYTDAQGGRTGFGALMLGVYEDGELKYSGRVGTGFDHATLRDIKKTLSAMEIDESPFTINSPKGKGLHWVKPVKVAEVSFANWTDEGILRTPVFMGLRTDKPAKDIRMEKAMTMEAKTKTKTKKLKDVSSPDKILFKKEKITKKQVAEFYQAISKHMLPYMENRPLSLVRCPDGSEGTCFFQKHISKGKPASFQEVPMPETSGVGIYLSIDSEEGLRDLVQMNAFELHASNCHNDDVMRPDQIVMDFDPGPDVPWKMVVDAAFELKEMLEQLGLKSFVKMTGGKGLHVHIPVAPLYDWDQIKSFSQTLALQMVSTGPEKYVANMSKKLRKGKIFVDYLRNGYGATAVVPYSLRAKPLSAVAIPVDWKELRRIKGPQEFTLAKALKKIKSRRVDPWKGMLKLKQKISILEPAGKAKKAA